MEGDPEVRRVVIRISLSPTHRVYGISVPHVVSLALRKEPLICLREPFIVELSSPIDAYIPVDLALPNLAPCNPTVRSLPGALLSARSRSLALRRATPAWWSLRGSQSRASGRFRGRSAGWS